MEFVNGHNNPPLHLQEEANHDELRRMLWYYQAPENPDDEMQNPDNEIKAYHYVSNTGSGNSSYIDSEKGAKLAELAFKMNNVSPHNLFRLYALSGWNKLIRKYREAAQHNMVRNLDLVNCHPTILHEMYPHKVHLKKYVEDRKTCLAAVMSSYKVSKSEAKDLYRAVLYGGREETWCRKNNRGSNEYLLSDLESECKEIMEDLANEYPTWYEYLRKNNTGQSCVKASLMSHVCMEKERNIINALMAHFGDRTRSILFDEISVSPVDGISKDADLTSAQEVVTRISPNMRIALKDEHKPAPLIPYERDNVFNIDTVKIIMGRYKAVTFVISDARKKKPTIRLEKDRCFTNDAQKFLYIPAGFKNRDASYLEKVNYLTKMLPWFHAVHYMNRFFAVCKDKTYIFSYNEDGTVNTSDYVMNDKFKSRYGQTVTKITPKESDGHYTFTTQEVQLTQYWAQTPRQIEGVGLFFPGESIPAKYINVFSGLATQPIEALTREVCEGVNFIMTHQKDILCDDHDEFFAFYQNWVGNLLQFKGKLRIMLVIVSDHQQIGKGIIWDQKGLFHRIIGDKYYYKPSSRLTDSEGLLGSFNYGHHNKLLLYLDEVSNYAGAIQANNRLKAHLSSDVVTYNKKMETAVEIRDRSSIVITSNENSCVRIEKEDARTAMISSSNKYSAHNAGENVGGMTPAIRKAYFKKMQGYIENPNVRSAILHFYQTYDIVPIYDLKIPETEARKKAKDFVESPVDDFVRMWREQGDQFRTTFSRHFNKRRDAEKTSTVREGRPEPEVMDFVRQQDLWSIFSGLWSYLGRSHNITPKKFSARMEILARETTSHIERVDNCKADDWGKRNCVAYRMTENTRPPQPIIDRQQDLMDHQEQLRQMEQTNGPQPIIEPMRDANQDIMDHQEQIRQTFGPTDTHVDYDSDSSIL